MIAASPNTSNNDAANVMVNTRSILLFPEMGIISSHKYCIILPDVMHHCVVKFNLGEKLK